MNHGAGMGLGARMCPAWKNKSEVFSDSVPWHCPSFSLSATQSLPAPLQARTSAPSPRAAVVMQSGKQLRSQTQIWLSHWFVICDLDKWIWSVWELHWLQWVILPSAAQDGKPPHHTLTRFTLQMIVKLYPLPLLTSSFFYNNLCYLVGPKHHTMSI